VVDNYGDIGVVYRFARAFRHAHPETRIRVFIDNLVTFNAINCCIDTTKTVQEHESIIYINTSSLDETLLDTLGTADVIIEAFACFPPDKYMKRAFYDSTLLINLEHLSAEPWVEEYHCKESLLPEGTLRKFYFMPGFTKNTGGLLLDTICSPNTCTDAEKIQQINALLPGDYSIEPCDNMLVGTVFTYRRGMLRLIQDCLSIGTPVCLLVFGEKSIESIRYAVQDYTTMSEKPHRLVIQNCTIITMPFLSQITYDTLLTYTDFNIVRGEDSLVRAILAGKPFIWNAYLQDNQYHLVKVRALCEMMKAWFHDLSEYKLYNELLIEFNRAQEESINQSTSESYSSFLHNLKKNEQIFREISYFMTQNCDLVKNITNFIREYPNSIG
jgi:uncharacterized repeat protein (TIGR03837 family)